MPENHRKINRSAKDRADAREFACEVARMIRDDKCENVLVLDVQNLSQVTDFIVIGSGTSDRQMKSVLDHVEGLAKDVGYPAFRSTADDGATWLLADFVDVVVHLFEPNTRAHYDLEMLWGDAKRLDWDSRERATTKRAADTG
jgi:ribosome-associated protein